MSGMWSVLDNPQRQQKDIVILSVPFVDSPAPVAAPAVLKSVVEKHGFSCLAVDCNSPVYQKVNQHKHGVDMIDFYLHGNVAESVGSEIFNDLDRLTDQILSWNPTWVGLSLLSSETQNAAKWILYLLKKKQPGIKTLLGGSGSGTSANILGSFVPTMFSQGLLDFHIDGDGELALIEALKSNTDFPGINGQPKRYLTDEEIDQLPFADYSDYNLEHWADPKINITASRGCVRQCKFCHYIEAHKKFQWRRADRVFAEMLSQINRYGITKFAFADSLVNGNVKEFNRLITLLAEHNENNPTQPIRWSGFYILRNRSANDEWLWDTLKKSGAVRLAVGVESFSQKIRYELGKKFDDDAIIHHFRLAQKHGIGIIALLLVGYPTETPEDIKICIEWIKNNSNLGDTVGLSFASMAIIPGTQLDRDKFRFGVIMQEDTRELNRSREWVTDQFQHVNNWQTRQQWLKTYYQTAVENGFRTDIDYSTFQQRYLTDIDRAPKDPRSILEQSL